MGVGEFIVAIAIIKGVFFTIYEVLKIIKWKLEYDMSVKKDEDEFNDFIKEGDLK